MELPLDEDADEYKNLKDLPPDRRLHAWRESFASRLDLSLGMNVRQDLLEQLGDCLVTYQSPSKGLYNFGQIIAISIKNPQEVGKALDSLQRGLEGITATRTRVRKKLYHGVELHEIYQTGLGFFVPTYAIDGKWLAIGLYPQSVQGFVMRSTGKQPTWKPDATTAARLARLPADAALLQHTDPRSCIQQMLQLAPFFVAASTQFDADFRNEPIDLGLIPNALEVNQFLFPNLTTNRKVDSRLRMESAVSLNLLLEITGPEIPLFLSIVNRIAHCFGDDGRITWLQRNPVRRNASDRVNSGQLTGKSAKWELH